MRRRLTSLGLLAFLGLGTMAFAQVTGVVNDGNNFPESDVEVTVKGTDKVAYTDENGNFNIDAKVGDTLIINGKEFKVTPRGNEAYKKQTLLNSSSFIGKQLTCVFYEYTEDGLPYHIIDNIVRDYE